MIEPKRFTIYLSQEELEILDAVASNKKMSRSSLMRNLLIYQGLCGGEMPLTRKILALPDETRRAVLSEIRDKAIANDPQTPQKWHQIIKEVLGSADSVTQEMAADAILKRLLGH